MRNVGRNVNEIPGVSFIAELQALSSTHACATSDDVDYCLELAMMVGTSFGLRLNDYSTGPELTGADAGVRDRGGSRHSGCLRRVGIQFIRADNLYAMGFPVQCLYVSPCGGDAVSQH